MAVSSSSLPSKSFGLAARILASLSTGMVKVGYLLVGF